jgi:hypothetical protein
VAFKKPYYEQDNRTRRDSEGMPLFMAYELFDDWIPDSADPSMLLQLGQRCATAWSVEALPKWRSRVLTAVELLLRISPNDSGKLVEIIIATMESYFAPQKSSYFTIKERLDKEDAEEAEVRFSALFQEYNNKLENVYRHLGTIFAFAKDSAFSNPSTVKSADWWLQQSAKTKISKLDSPVIIGSLPINILVEGYDRHFRNAIAHFRYKCINRELVEMWDVNEKGKETWRAQLFYADCKEKLRNLSLTISVMEAAYFLFAINNAVDLQAARMKMPAPQMDAEERRLVIYEVAHRTYNLDVQDLMDDGSGLVIDAHIIKNHDIPQTSKVYVGGDKWAKSFDVEQRVESIELKRVVFGFLRTLRRNLGTIPSITVSIKDEDGNNAGRVVVDQSQLDFLATANDSAVGVDSLPSVENTIRPVMVKFTHRSRPRRFVPKPPAILTPPEKRIIIP